MARFAAVWRKMAGCGMTWVAKSQCARIGKYARHVVPAWYTHERTETKSIRPAISLQFHLLKTESRGAADRANQNPLSKLAG